MMRLASGGQLRASLNDSQLSAEGDKMKHVYSDTKNSIGSFQSNKYGISHKKSQP